MKGIMKFIGLVILVALVIMAIVGLKDVVDNGWDNSHVKAIWTSLTEKTTAFKDGAATDVDVTDLEEPTTQPINLEIAACDFLREAQNNQYGALNGTYRSDVEYLTLTSQEDLVGKYVIFTVAGKEFSVYVADKAFNDKELKAKVDIDLQLCAEHNSLANVTMRDGDDVVILLTQDFLSKLDVVACRWNENGEWVYGVKLCDHNAPETPAGDDDGGDDDDPTPTPTPVPTPEPTPVLPPPEETEDPEPSLPPIDDVDPEPSHNPQPTVIIAPPEQQEELDDDEDEFWTTDEEPSNPGHNPQGEESAHNPAPASVAILPEVESEAVVTLVAPTETENGSNPVHSVQEESTASVVTLAAPVVENAPVAVLAPMENTAPSAPAAQVADAQSDLDAGEEFGW